MVNINKVTAVNLARKLHPEFTDERARERRVGASLSRYSDMNPIVDMLRVDPRLVVTWRDSVCYIGSK